CGFERRTHDGIRFGGHEDRFHGEGLLRSGRNSVLVGSERPLPVLLHRQFRRTVWASPECGRLRRIVSVAWGHDAAGFVSDQECAVWRNDVCSERQNAASAPDNKKTPSKERHILRGHDMLEAAKEGPCLTDAAR
ncbi:MAG: hypothetical protein WB820_12710, partial [Rhodoplanes sp.]